MKAIGSIFKILFFCLLLIDAGCEPEQSKGKSPVKVESTTNVSAYAQYVPVKIKIMPLTEIIGNSNSKVDSKIIVYVSLLDTFGCQIKSPVVFRFELYERILRSGEPKGRRIVIWQSIDLTEAAENNDYWRDFLRAYEFNLDFEPQRKQAYILQVTCLCPSGKRLTAEFSLKVTK